MQVIPGRPGSRAERHPRASATPEITKVTVHCGVSASTGSVGRRRCPAPVPTTWTSTTPGSSRRISSTVRTVFSCVASRCRWALQPGLSGEKRRVSQFGLPHPVKPQPSRGESISFLSPAQAAGAPTFCDATESRQRTQPRGLRPLGHPPPFFGLPSQKVRPVAHPPEVVQNPGWSAQRHRRGRAMLRIVTGSSQSSAEISLRRPPPPPLRTGLLLENRDRRSRAPPPPPAEGATSLLLRRLRGRLLKRTSPHGLWPHA